MNSTIHDQDFANIDIDEIRKNIAKLPMLPVVVYELMKYDPNSKNFYDVVLKMAQSDPPLATALLGYANSAAFAQHQATRISSVKSALSRVGAKRLFELLFTGTVTRVFLPHKNEHRQLWRHSLQVAHLATYLIEYQKHAFVDSQQAYMAGLLHDIGRFVMLQLAPHALDKTDAEGWHTAVELVEVEKQVTGHTHADVGLMTCKRLHLPRLISLAVQYHHQPEVLESPSLSDENRQLLTAIMIADDLSFFINDDDNHRHLPPKELKQYLQDTILSEHIDTELVAFNRLCYEFNPVLKRIDDVLETFGVN
ncbi:MAG: HDOD domain-containing protein [Pseudomonadota bacterium]